MTKEQYERLLELSQLKAPPPKKQKQPEGELLTRILKGIPGMSLKPKHLEVPTTDADPYYLLDEYIRNGTLGKLELQMKGKEENDWREAYRFGSLFDMYTTDRERFDKTLTGSGDNYSLLSESGHRLRMDEEEFEQIKLMSDSLFANYPFLKLADTQTVIKRDEFQVGKYTIRAKIKCDFSFERGQCPAFPKFKVQVDLKSTTCLNQKEFDKRFIQYSYDRGGAFYLDVGQTEVNLILAVNRSGDIFTRYIARETLKRGRIKYTKIINYAAPRGLLPEGVLVKSN